VALRLALALIALLAIGLADGAERWEKDIQGFEAQDHAKPPVPGGIVCYGSSTFTLWTSMADDLAGLPVVNRGFGGAGIDDALRYAERVVAPHRPRVVVLYAGGNNIGKQSPAEIAGEMQALIAKLRALTPAPRIVLLSLKPTLKRLDQEAQTVEINRHYATLAQAGAVDVLDLWTPFLDAQGKPDPQWLAQDGHHPSRAGYQRIAGLLRPLLERK
jgi:lysophospholipase L1-like esterase